MHAWPNSYCHRVMRVLFSLLAGKWSELQIELSCKEEMLRSELPNLQRRGEQPLSNKKAQEAFSYHEIFKNKTLTWEIPNYLLQLCWYSFLSGHKDLSFLYSWWTPHFFLFKNSHSYVIKGRSGWLESAFDLEWAWLCHLTAIWSCSKGHYLPGSDLFFPLASK